MIAAARVLRFEPTTTRQRQLLFVLVHWGYGSFVGVGHEVLSRRFGPTPKSTAIFFAGVKTMAFTLLPPLGGTPVPWRWRRDVLATSLVQHAVYAVTTGLVVARLATPAAAEPANSGRFLPRAMA